MNHKRELEEHFDSLSNEDIITTLKIMESIEYTPDFYDYVIADSMNIISILLFINKRPEINIESIQTKEKSLREKLETLGISSTNNLQERYLIFPSFNEYTGTLRICYFYNSVVTPGVISPHITSGYSDTLKLSKIIETFEKDIADLNKECRSMINDIEQKFIVKVNEKYSEIISEEQNTLIDTLFNKTKKTMINMFPFILGTVVGIVISGHL